MDLTSRLALNKPNPDPETGDYLDVQKLNENFDKIDSAINVTLCTAATRPAAPFQGQFILETDTGRLYVRVGTIWQQIPVGGSRDLAYRETERPTATEWSWSTHVNGDPQKRLIIQGNGQLNWGDGTAAVDTTLYRGGANLLKTDDAFQAVGPLNAHLTAVKSGNTPLPNQAALQNDPHLVIPVEANAQYLMDGDIIYYSATGVDLMTGFSGPTGATMEWASYAPSEGHTTPAYEGGLKFESRNITQSQSWGGTGSIIHAAPRGMLQTAGTAGSLQFRWSQRVANADTSIVYAKSWIRLHRVA